MGDLPAPGGGLTYLSQLLQPLVLQASYDGTSVHFFTLGGHEVCQITAVPTDRLSQIHAQLAATLRAGMIGHWRKVEIVLPSGELLVGMSTIAASISGGDPPRE